MRIIPAKDAAAILPSNLSFTGQTVLVTGATSGLGLETAIHYCKLDAATVIITSRTAERGVAARATIESRTGKKGVVQVRVLDMDTFAGVISFITKLRSEITTIDIVLLNAGLINFDYIPSPDGWEGVLQVNVLSTTLLGLLLLPWMRSVKKTGQTQHLSFTGSWSHTEPKITGRYLGKSWPQTNVLEYWNKRENNPSGQKEYAISKLLFHYAANEIAKLASKGKDGPSPIVNTVCPGAVRTDLARNLTSKGFVYKVVVEAFMLVTMSAEDGAKALVSVATTTKERHGKFTLAYKTDAQYAELAALNMTNAAGKKMQAQVWSEIVGVLKAVHSDVEGIVCQ